MPAIGSNLDSLKEKIPYKIPEYQYRSEYVNKKNKRWDEHDPEEADEPVVSVI